MPRVFVPVKGTQYVEITEGDTATVLDFQLFDAGDAPQSLRGALSVTFTMTRKVDGALTQPPTACTIANADAGLGSVKPVVRARGTHVARFVVVFADDSEQSFPNGWDLIVNVRRR